MNLHSYFAGLLPEGLRLKALVARAKTSQDDLFTLLVAAGPDCIGDLFVTLPGTQGRPLEREAEELERLDAVSFDTLFERSVASPDEPAVPGVQEKLSPSVISFPFATAGKRWILKLNPADKPLLIQNEQFFMQMARGCGLDVAKTRLVHDRGEAAGLLACRTPLPPPRGRPLARAPPGRRLPAARQVPFREIRRQHLGALGRAGRLCFARRRTDAPDRARRLQLPHRQRRPSREEPQRRRPAGNFAADARLRSAQHPPHGRDDNLERAGLLAFGAGGAPHAQFPQLSSGW